MVVFATPADVPELCQMEYVLFPENNLSEEALEQELCLSRCWLARGQSYLLARPGELWDVLRLGVLPEHQGQGLGRLLLRLCLQEARGPVMLTVHRANVAALGLYRSEGFRPVGMVLEALMLRRG